MKKLIRFGALLCLVALLMSSCATKEKNLLLDTPYGALQYPDDWGDALVVEEGEQDGIYAKTFATEFSADRYPLFTVYFGNSSQGTLYGYLREGERVTPIYIECFMLPEGHPLTAEEETQFYEMLDGINAVVASIQAIPGYSDTL